MHGFYTSCLLFLRPTTRYGPGIWFPNWQVQTKLKFKIKNINNLFFRDFDFLCVGIPTVMTGLVQHTHAQNTLFGVLLYRFVLRGYLITFGSETRVT